MNTYRHAATQRLDIAYLEWNPQGARTAVLLHGWPDSPQCWKSVARILADSGYRVLAPALRGASRPPGFSIRARVAAASCPRWGAIFWISSTCCKLSGRSSSDMIGAHARSRMRAACEMAWLHIW
ncbi:pimeloyl-ACP methyl ester carboxylesterase [Paraburkholderia youngii]